jgi:hypothetical protein
MKECSPSYGQNSQLVNLWVLVHSGRHLHTLQDWIMCCFQTLELILETDLQFFKLQLTDPIAKLWMTLHCVRIISILKGDYVIQHHPTVHHSLETRYEIMTHLWTNHNLGNLYCKHLISITLVSVLGRLFQLIANSETIQWSFSNANSCLVFTCPKECTSLHNVLQQQSICIFRWSCVQHRSLSTLDGGEDLLTCTFKNISPNGHR